MITDKKWFQLLIAIGQVHLINITPRPILIWERFYNRVSRLVEVLRRMFVFRGITATDMTAGHANTQFHPFVA